jgi:hypothetical protein
MVVCGGDNMISNSCSRNRIGIGSKIDETKGVVESNRSGGEVDETKGVVESQP